MSTIPSRGSHLHRPIRHLIRYQIALPVAYLEVTPSTPTQFFIPQIGERGDLDGDGVPV
jgi:hypothetical protein